MILDAISIQTANGKHRGYLIILPSGRTLFSQDARDVTEARLVKDFSDGMQLVSTPLTVTEKQFRELATKPCSVDELRERDKLDEAKADG